jgi:predicted dehydrogenase
VCSSDLDLFRHILDDEYATVSGCSFKPPWSIYESDTGVNLSFKTRKGVIVVYSGTISSMNGSMSQESLIIEGENGSLVNESDWLEPPLWFHPKGKKERINLAEQINDCSVAGQYNRSDEFILTDFAQAIRGNGKPLCGTRDGLRSVIAVEAGRKACETKREIALDIF